jgi:hypothetical protein
MILSPFRGDQERNRRYALYCLRNSVLSGEAGFAGHLVYPLILDDNLAEERQLGMSCGQAWMEAAELVAVYIDLGISSGMEADIDFAIKHKIQVVYRTLPAWREP